MSEDHIRYDILVQEALRKVVCKVMGEVAKTGLPGEHHFFISFITKAPGVRISERLLEQYEKEMTIVIQNQYWDFKVSETGFQIGLAFDGKNELLEIPFSAVKGFFDPSVQFGLQFDVEGTKEAEDEAEADNADEPKKIKNKTEKVSRLKKPKKQKKNDKDDKDKEVSKRDETDSKEKDGSDKVVSLDSFRKK